MSIFNRKKALQEKLNELENQTKRLLSSLKSGDFLTAEMIQRIANFNADVARARIFANNQEVEEVKKINTVLNYIRNWEIPPEGNWGWDYWVHLDQITDYWIGRYSNFEGNEKYTKDAILTALRVGIKFGMSGIEKATGIPYFCTALQNGNYRCYSATDMLDYNNEPFKQITNTVKKTKRYAVSSNVQILKELEPAEIIIYTRRSTKIGDFVWYLKDLLTHIFNKYCISNGILAVCPKMLCSVDGQMNDAAIKNCERLADPSQPIKIIVKSSPFATNKGEKYFGDFRLAEGSTYTDIKGTQDMIMITKFHYEEFCNNNGIPITSSKEQSLSSDANLGTYTANCRTKALDNHVLDFFKELGIKLTIEEPETTPQNDNADKNGGGTANTEGDKIKEEKND